MVYHSPKGQNRRLSARLRLRIAALVIGLLFFVTAFSGALYTWEPEFSRILRAPLAIRGAPPR